MYVYGKCDHDQKAQKLVYNPVIKSLKNVNQLELRDSYLELMVKLCRKSPCRNSHTCEWNEPLHLLHSTHVSWTPPSYIHRTLSISTDLMALLVGISERYYKYVQHLISCCLYVQITGITSTGIICFTNCNIFNNCTGIGTRGAVAV